jgi:hypothetical protein
MSDGRRPVKGNEDPKFAAGVERSEVYAGVTLLSADLVVHRKFIIDGYDRTLMR